jgi:rSAM/selenodomain-associated transferase 2
VRLSIVVPVLNEASGLSCFLRHLRDRVPDDEVIVVDGGSTDGTWQLAQSLRAELVFELLRAPRGRGSQMNAGVRASSGDLLWFLHADSQLEPGCLGTMKVAAADPALAGGCFRLRISAGQLLYRVSDSLGNLGVHLFRIALGDHGIFCRRAIFDQIGGYQEVPLMEDARFYRSLARYGSVRQLRPHITTSARAYERHGPLCTTFAYSAILVLHAAGMPLRWQLAIYSWNLRAAPRLVARQQAAINEHNDLPSAMRPP